MTVTALSNFVMPLSALLTAPILARGLGVDGRGALAAAIAPFMLMISVANFGIPEAILYHTALRPITAWQNVSTGLRVLLVGGLLSGFLTVAMSGWASSGNDTVRVAIIGVAIVIPFTIYGSAFRGAAAGLQRWRLVAAEKTVNGLSRLTSIYALWMFDCMTVLNVVWCIALPNALSCLVYAPLVRLKKRSRTVTPTAKELSRYGAKVWGGAISGILLTRLDQAIMAPLAGVAQLGYYTVAVNVADVSILTNNAMRDVTVSSDAADNDNDRLFLTARVSMLLSLVVAVVIAATIWVWFTPLFGAEFQPAIIVVLVLLGGAALATPGSVAGAGLNARGHPGLRSWSLAIALGVNVVTFVLLAPKWGAIGAAFATAIASQVSSQCNAVWFRRRYGGRWRDFYRPTPTDLRHLRQAVKRMVKG